MNARPYLLLFLTSAKEVITNKWLIVAGVFLTVVRLFLYAAIYEVVERAADVGLTFANIAASLALFLIFNFNLSLRDLVPMIGGEVVSGGIESELLEPHNWQLAKVCDVLGKNSIECGLALLIVPIFLVWRTGTPDVSFWSVGFVLGYLVLSVLATISSCALFMMVGLIVFWLEDTWVLSMLAQRLISVLAGGFVPVALLSDLVQTLIRYSPFGVFGAPTQLFSPSLRASLWPYVVASAVWTVVMLWASRRLWWRAQRRLAINGVRNA